MNDNNPFINNSKDNPIRATPENLAHILFNTKLYSNVSEEENPICDVFKNKFELFDPKDTEYSHQFEILLTILFEGIHYVCNLYDVENEDFDVEYLDELNPLFEKIGYQLCVVEVPNNELNNDHYCRVMLNSGRDKGYFIMKEIDKPYTFLVNSNFVDIMEDDEEDLQLEDYSCLIEKDEQSVCIAFIKHVPLSSIYE